MAAQQQITVRVAKDGSITAETHNILGAKCMDYIAVLEDVLEASTLSSSFTSDYQATHTAVDDVIEERNDLHQQ